MNFYTIDNEDLYDKSFTDHIYLINLNSISFFVVHDNFVTIFLNDYNSIDITLDCYVSLLEHINRY